MSSKEGSTPGKRTLLTPTTILPRLKGARPTIHADLLRPVLLNRAKNVGHPGAPPRAPASRRRRKRQNLPHPRCIAEEGKPRTPTPTSENSHQDSHSRIKRNRCPGRHFAETAGSGRGNKHTRLGGHRKSGTTTGMAVSFQGDRPLNPLSSTCVCASSVSPDLDRHRTQQGPEIRRAVGRDSYQIDVPRSRDEEDAQPQADVRVAPALVTSKDGKRRASLLRFRPATRQELNRPNNWKYPMAATTVAQKVRVGETAQLLSSEHGQRPKETWRGRRQSKHFGGAVVESHSPLLLLLRDDHMSTEDARQQRGSSGTLPVFDPCNMTEALVLDEKGEESVSVPESSGDLDGFDESPPGTPTSHSGKGKPVRQQRIEVDVHVGQQRCKELRGHHDNRDSGGDNNCKSDALAGRPGYVSSPCSRSNPMLYHVARCMCELCRRGRAKRKSRPPEWPTFKFVGGEPRLVLATLQAQRFRRYSGGRATRVGDKAAWRLLWSSQHLRSHVFRNLKRGQRINSFPRTYECTRKDALSRNMNRMIELHGARHFGFAPRGFVLPAEREALREAMLDKSEGEAWIVKPASSACGRGIYITKDFAEMPEGTGSEGNWIAQRYVEDPLLLDGLKFDLRLYVAVTSFRPLRVYLHKEGLCRLATETYRPDAESFGNHFIHLTNYSINRKSSRYEPGTARTDEADDDEGPHHDEPFARTARSLSRSPEHASHTVSDELATTPHRHRGTSVSADVSFSGTVSELAGSTNSKKCGTANTDPTISAAAGIRGSSAKVAAGGEECGTSATMTPPVGSTESTRANASEGTGKGQGTGKRSSSPNGRRVGGGIGSKWNLKALRRKLAGMGVDVPALWGNIHSLVVKTLIAIEAQVSSAVELLAIRRGSCFEMFGFDVLVDQQHRPHLLEVNFAPSLNTDSDLDLDIKSKVVADLLTLAGIRGPSELQRTASTGSNATTGSSAVKHREEVHRQGQTPVHRKPSNTESIQGVVCDGGGVRRNNNSNGAGNTPVAVDGGVAAVGELRKINTNSPDSCGVGQASAVGRRQGQGTKTSGTRSSMRPWAEGGVDFVGQLARQRTKGSERRRPTGRPSGRQRLVSGVGNSGGSCDKAAPAWEGSIRTEDGRALSAEEMSAIVLESESELRRSGGFELIFPVASSANKYFKFFDGPRPLERLLAIASAAILPREDTGDVCGKAAALKRMRNGRRSQRRVSEGGGRNGEDGQDQRLSVDPTVRKLIVRVR